MLYHATGQVLELVADMWVVLHSSMQWCICYVYRAYAIQPPALKTKMLGLRWLVGCRQGEITLSAHECSTKEACGQGLMRPYLPLCQTV